MKTQRTPQFGNGGGGGVAGYVLIAPKGAKLQSRVQVYCSSGDQGGGGGGRKGPLLRSSQPLLLHSIPRLALA